MSAEADPDTTPEDTPSSELPHVDDVEFADEVYDRHSTLPDVDGTALLTADDVADKHRYLATALPDWRASMATIKAKGGPWWCKGCQGASLLGHRCSMCGRDLAGDTTTQGRQSG